MGQQNNENKTHRELKERIKELNCLYGLSRLMDKRDISESELLQSAVNLISPAWQYPGITCARLILNEQEFKTEGFKETQWKQSADIVVNNNTEGRLDVFYLEEKPEKDEGPFLEEERNLIDTFTNQLAHYLVHKKEERELYENEENLRITINSIGDAVIATDKKGRITRMNPVAEKLTGWAEADAENQALEKVFNIFNAKSDKKVENPVKEVLETGKIGGLTNDTKLISKNREEYLIDDSGSPIKNERGEITGVVLVFRDVTDDYQLRENIKENEYRFKQLFQHMSSSVAVYRAVDGGKDFEFVDFNAAAEQVEKINKEDVIGKKVTEVFPAVRDFGLFDVFKRVWQNGKAEHHPTSKYKDNRIAGYRNNYVYKLPSGEIVALYDDVTQQKQADERLRESERQLATLMGNLPGMAYRCRNDQNWTMEFVSSGCLGLTGYNDKQLTNNLVVSYADLVHPEDREKVWKEVQQAIQNNQPFLIEYRIHDKEKNMKWVWEQGRNVDTDSDGTDILEGFIMDITERKEADEKTRKSEQKFRDIFNHSADAIVIQDRQGYFIEVNDSACQRSGYSRKEFLNNHHFDIESPEYTQRIEERLNIIKQNGEATFETIFRRKDGSKMTMEGNARLTEYEGETAILSVVRDISERRKSEKVKELLYNVSQLSVSDINLKQYLEAIHKEVSEIMKADNFYIALYDKNADKYTMPYHVDEYDDLTTDELVSLKHTLTDYIRKTGEAKLVTGEIERKLRQKESIRTVGTPSPVWIGAPIYDSSSDEVTGVIALQDYENKNAYNKDDVHTLSIIATNIGIFIERINNLENLKKAKEKAEESDRLKSAFLANMSHEIRTPMNGILGFTDLLMEPDLTGEEKNEYTEIIHKSGQRMMNTVNDIVEISKIEAGIISIQKAATNANEVVKELVNFFRSETQKKSLTLELDQLLPDKASTLLTDQSKLESILTNLIKNAIKYTDSGSINVGCRLKDDFIKFYVKDTGIGVPHHRQDAIFNRFEQADISDTRAFEGSGLGLAISKSYVEMLGGEIGLESEENKGSTFYFTLPASKAEKSPSSEEREKQAKEQYAAKTEEPARKLKILVAEDDEDSFLYLKTLLRKIDCEIIQTITGTETVEKSRNNPDIDLILMDIKLPEMDGYQATRKIREFNQKVPIIAQTAYAMVGDSQKALDTGCDDYIAKPIKKDDLMEKINRFIKSE